MRLHKIISGYTKVSNEVLNNSNLSMKAKGLYAYLVSKPDDYDFSTVRIVEDFSDGIDALRAAILELEEARFLVRKRHGDGTIDYLIGSVPIPLEPLLENPTEGKTHRGKIQHISNTDKNNKTDKTLREGESQEIGKIIKAFETINPAAKNFYNNPPQRRACVELISTHGFERVISVVENTLPKSNRVEYIPTVTTPKQLFEKWAALEAAIFKLKGKSDKITKVAFQ